MPNPNDISYATHEQVSQVPLIDLTFGFMSMRNHGKPHDPGRTATSISSSLPATTRHSASGTGPKLLLRTTSRRPGNTHAPTIDPFEGLMAPRALSWNLINIYIYICIYICICICMYIHTYIYSYVCLSLCFLSALLSLCFLCGFRFMFIFIFKFIFKFTNSTICRNLNP